MDIGAFNPFLSNPTLAMSDASPLLASSAQSLTSQPAGPAVPDMPEFAFHAPPAPPPPLTADDLLPSRRASAIEGIAPLMGAALAAMFGGRAAAAGELHGALQGVDAYEQQRQQRALLEQQQREKKYAQDLALYQDDYQRAHDRANTISKLMTEASQFDDPDVARQWLASQAPVYAPMGIDTTTIFKGGKLPGEDEKVRTGAANAFKTNLDAITKLDPTPDLNRYSVTYRGRRMKMSELGQLGGIATLADGTLPVPQGKADANSQYNDYVESFRKTTGREPNALERAQLREAALRSYAASSKKPDDGLDRQIKNARLAVLNLTLKQKLAEDAVIEAAQGAGAPALSPQQQAMASQVQQDFEASSADFNRRAQAHDNALHLADGPMTPETSRQLLKEVSKLIDPSTDLVDSLRPMFNKTLTSGSALSQTQVRDLVGRANRAYQGLRGGQQQRVDAASRALRGAGITNPESYLAHQGSIHDAPMSPRQAAPGVGVPAEPQATGRNEAYLASLPAQVQPIVQKIAEGKMAIPSSFALKDPYWKAILDMVGRYDPTFDAVNYNARAATRKAFTSGKEGAQINALNTAIQHMRRLSDKIAELGNYGGLATPANILANPVRSAFGSSAVNNFETVRENVIDELVRAWRQAGGTKEDIDSRKRNLSSNASPNVLNDAVVELGDMLMAKVNSLQAQYNAGMGTSGLTLLSPEARQSLALFEQRAGHMADIPATSPAAATRANGGKPVSGVTPGTPGTARTPVNSTVMRGGKMYRVKGYTPQGQMILEPAGSISVAGLGQ